MHISLCQLLSTPGQLSAKGFMQDIGERPGDLVSADGAMLAD